MRFLIKTSMLLAAAAVFLALMAAQALAGPAPTITGSADCTEDGQIVIYLSGSGVAPGSLVNIAMSGDTWTVASDVNGDWSLVKTVPASMGPGTVYPAVIDSAYNVLAQTEIVLSDCTAPPPALAPAITGDATCLEDGQVLVNLTGSGAFPSAPIDIYLEGSLFGSAMSDVNGDWSFSATVSLPPGTYHVDAGVQDMLLAGNDIDVPDCEIPPPPPDRNMTLYATADCIGGEIEVSGTGAPANLTFEVYMGFGPDVADAPVVLLGSVTSGVDGSWSLTSTVPESLSPDIYSVWITLPGMTEAFTEVSVRDCTSPPPPPPTSLHLKTLPKTGSQMFLIAAAALTVGGFAASAYGYSRKRT